jgi:hypothetical protein
LPPWFKQKHPQIVQNLKTNKNRLTTPFDLHMTLKHTIELSGRTEKLPKALSCPQAQSLFEVVPWNRSCDDACIEFHWCSCTKYKKLDKDDRKAMKARNFVLDWINNELELKARKDDKALCQTLKISKITKSEISEIFDANSKNKYVYYLVSFRTSPSDAHFEATVAYHFNTSEFKINGQISRCNSYGLQSECVTDNQLKLYCLCNDFMPIWVSHMSMDLRKKFNLTDNPVPEGWTWPTVTGGKKQVLVAHGTFNKRISSDTNTTQKINKDSWTENN